MKPTSILAALPLFLSACSFSGDSYTAPQITTPPPCSPAWNALADTTLKSEGITLPTPAGGPLWIQALESSLPADTPWPKPQGEEAWCTAADSRLRSVMRAAIQPSFPCGGSEADTTAGTICRSLELSRLDRTLAKTLASCTEQSAEETRRSLERRQRTWEKGRSTCGTGEEAIPCLTESYKERIATLQAKFDLVPKNGPFHFRCPQNPDGDLTATIYATTPPALLAVREDSEAVLFLVPSDHGVKYEGRDTMIQESKGRAGVRWGFGAETIECNADH